MFYIGRNEESVGVVNGDLGRGEGWVGDEGGFVIG